MVSLFDVTAEHGMTVSVSRQGVKLTRAAIGAVAIIEFPSFKHPLDVRHGVPPHSHSRATAQWQTNPTKTGQVRIATSCLTLEVDVGELLESLGRKWRLSEDYLPVGQIDPPFEKSRVPSVINFCQL